MFTPDDAAALAAIIKDHVTAATKPLLDRLDEHYSLIKAFGQIHVGDMVKESVVEEFAKLKMPVDGIDGRDGLDIEILPDIDEQKSYARGRYATHKGGLWRSYEQTDGMRGWECIVNGVDDIHARQVDAKRLEITAVTSKGGARNFVFNFPAMIYRDVYKSDETYAAGDCVTWGGSLWHCNVAETKTKPGDGQDWTLAAKKGRDGRDGRDVNGTAKAVRV